MGGSSARVRAPLGATRTRIFRHIALPLLGGHLLPALLLRSISSVVTAGSVALSLFAGFLAPYALSRFPLLAPGLSLTLSQSIYRNASTCCPEYHLT